MGTSLASVLLLLVAFASAAQLPSSMKTCKQTDPDFNDCLKKAIQDAIPILTKGIASLSLPPLDPLHFTQIKIEDTPERPVSLSLEFNEVDLTGVGSAIIDWVEMKPSSYHMKLKLHADSSLSLVGPYKAIGKVLVLPIQGEGNSNVTASGLEALLEISGHPMERDGDTHWDVTDLKMDSKLEKLSIDLTGLYKDKALTDNTLKFLNENSAEITNELKPAIEEAMAA